MAHWVRCHSGSLLSLTGLLCLAAVVSAAVCPFFGASEKTQISILAFLCPLSTLAMIACLGSVGMATILAGRKTKDDRTHSAAFRSIFLAEQQGEEGQYSAETRRRGCDTKLGTPADSDQ